MILQRCLRNEFATIEDYNASAGELAEPYRLLVVADFPAAFSEQSTRRLAAIAQSGPRCGVYILLGIDAAKAAALHHAWQDLRKIGDRLLWYEDRFLWLDPDLERYPLVPDEPPPADRLTPLIHSIGKAAAAASRVELPFEVIAPPRENWWEGDTARGIDIPLGRSGANRLQNLQLGSGTAQHVLIAGRTGSGKSTLLHALVTNAALRYGPDQIELYLIDFKKGVEFKTYASRKLPHARVIAIESDREFGLSVLEKLDRELKRRGELFRDAGVQDLPAYRARNGREVMPRILLVVDEFQEFFVEDDKLAQEASLLLDRLVRQGRAFGIHVHLGSQTLGGAYSLARSTLGQMAVRIALQCTETDAHLILSDDNSAARELARPGEAIYNDANGLAEGNSHFQVVWLDDRKRDRYLREIADLAKSRGVSPPEPIVFEGHAPADLARCEPLLRARGRKRSARLASVSAWLGEAVAIKDPTAVVFSPQAAANFLLIGPNEAAALGCLNALLESLAAQCTFAPPSAIASGDTPAETSHEPKAPHARLVLAHASSEGEPVHRWIESLEGRLALPVEVIPPRELSSVLAEFVAEYERRQTLTGTAPPPWFLLLVDLQRFRELRKSDDDFSFSRRGEEKPANPSKQFATLIREGPAVGLHTVIWCDGMNTLGRFFDRSTQKEFAHRVLFQMSAGDSSNLIDSPAASRLGPFRGLYYQEERATIEKFRPYGLPESAAGAVAIADADKDVDLQASS
jgi:energy-coupling factor transporter ATP-binding protein EcfA2